MPTLDEFDETSYSKSHLKMYIRAMQPLGATEELLAQMFQNTLTEAAFRWFLNLDVIRRDLEITKQEPKESFFTFITKWRSKAAQMMNRPSEEEQLTMVVKNLLPVYHKYFFA